MCPRCWALVRRRKLKNIARRKESSRRSCEDVRHPNPSRLFKRYLASKVLMNLWNWRVGGVFLGKTYDFCGFQGWSGFRFPLSCKGTYNKMTFWKSKEWDHWIVFFVFFCEERLELTAFGVWQKGQDVVPYGVSNICSCMIDFFKKSSRMMKVSGGRMSRWWVSKIFIGLPWGDDPSWRLRIFWNRLVQPPTGFGMESRGFHHH